VEKERYDYLIVGAGIIGMTVAYELNKKYPDLRIVIIDKENDVAQHASGRNSGVLHAGFYYSADSLKARFTVDGNAKMKQFCAEHGIIVNQTRKVVIAKNESEVEGIYELKRRADINGVEAEVIDEASLKRIDSNVKTHKIALYSPSTASVDPKEVCFSLKNDLIGKGIDFYFNTPFESSSIQYHYLINCSGLYADKVAQKFGLAKNYTMLPFKGIYLKYTNSDQPLTINVYPVPNLKNPFLGVHYTITVKNEIKIGPTAIPAFWRENYNGMKNFCFKELIEILYYEAKLFLLNAFNFRQLALSEMQNYNKSTFIKKAVRMVYNINHTFKPIPAGIRAQLLNKNSNELIMDFVVEHTKGSTHILNAVSPAFTCSFAFAEYVVQEIEKSRRKENE